MQWEAPNWRPNWGRIARIAGWTLGSISLLIVAAGVGGYLYLTSGDFRSRIADAAGAYSGRQTRIEKVSIDWSFTPRVRLAGVEVANSKWGKAPYMLKVAEAEFELRLWPLLKGDVVMPSLVLRKPEIAIEVGDKEQLNWSFGESPVVRGATEAAKPENRFETPLIGRLEITEGRIQYQDPRRKLQLDGTVSTAQGEAGEQPQAKLMLEGKLENQPLKLHFVGGSAVMLRDTSQPYPVELKIAFGGTQLAAKGTIDDPFSWKGANVDLTLSGPNLSEIYPLLGIPGPPTPPYRISGKLDREPGLWKFTNTKWRVGDSDLTGDVLIDDKRRPNFLAAKLVSNNLAFKDLAPLVGAPPGRGTVNARQAQTQAQLEATGNLFPNVPLHIEKLRAMNMDVTLDARKVVAPDYLPVQALSFRVLINDGVAVAKPLTLKLVSGGTIAGDMSIDARTDNPKVSTNLKANNIELQTFFRNSQYFDTTHGTIRGSVSLAGHGRSLAQVMGGADGHVEVALGGGSVSSLMVSLAGLQLFDALILYVSGDKRIPILCAMGRMNFNKGTITLDKTLLDTQKSVLDVRGTVALQSQVVGLEIKAYPKSFDLLDLHGPVSVTGKIRQPRVGIGRSFPIPTPVFGTAKDVDCPGLTERLFSGQ